MREKIAPHPGYLVFRNNLRSPLQKGPNRLCSFQVPCEYFFSWPRLPILDPPELETALHFLEIFTNLEDEFNRIDLVNTGLFDLEHPETAQQLDLTGALRAIKSKSRLAKNVLRWVEDNRYNVDSEELTGTEVLTS